MNKDILIDFLNAFLEQREGHIKDIWFKNSEQLGLSNETRGVIFDIYCENDLGEKFIDKLQKNYQNWFREWAVYYWDLPYIGTNN